MLPKDLAIDRAAQMCDCEEQMCGCPLGDFASVLLPHALVLPEGSVVVERLTAQCENMVNHPLDTTT